MCVPALCPSPFINEQVFLSRKLSQIESIRLLNCLLLLLLDLLKRGEWKSEKLQVTEAEKKVLTNVLLRL